MMQEFTSELKSFTKDAISEIHTALPGRIESFNPDRCEADVVPYGRFKKADGEMMAFPKIPGVPVLIPQGAGQNAAIAYPVKAGDECLLLFSEQTLELWRSGAESKTDLRFDLQNAVALVGLFAKPSPLMKEAAQKNAVVIANNGTKITLLPSGGVEIAGNVTINGNLTVSGSGTVGGVSVNKHTHTSSSPGNPTSAPN